MQRQSLASLVLDIVFSRPTPLKTNRLIVLATNAVLLACVAEFVSLPLVDPAADVIYTRVGAVAPTEAKIALRHPFTNASEGAVHVVYRQAAVPLGAVPHRWADGPIATVTAETDWTAVVRLTGLWPNTSYECTCGFLSLAIPRTLAYGGAQIASRTRKSSCCPFLSVRSRSGRSPTRACRAGTISGSS
jgi:hypothetical protein